MTVYTNFKNTPSYSFSHASSSTCCYPMLFLYAWQAAPDLPNRSSPPSFQPLALVHLDLSNIINSRKFCGFHYYVTSLMTILGFVAFACCVLNPTSTLKLLKPSMLLLRSNLVFHLTFWELIIMGSTILMNLMIIALNMGYNGNLLSLTPTTEWSDC